MRAERPYDEKDLFAGRSDQVDTVVDAIIQRGQHVVIFGEGGVGKTSLGNVLHGFLQNPVKRSILTPRVNCDAKDDFGSVWKKVFSQVVLTQEKKSMAMAGAPTPDRRSAADDLPNEITPNVVQGCLQSIGQATLLVVIIDESRSFRNPAR